MKAVTEKFATRWVRLRQWFVCEVFVSRRELKRIIAEKRVFINAMQSSHIEDVRQLREKIQEHERFADELVAREMKLESQLAAARELPGLSPAELERVALLAGKCAQVVDVCGKILRHGYESCSPFDDKCRPNRVLLERELGGLKSVIDLLASRGDIDKQELQAWRRRKFGSMRQWTHHQGFGESRGLAVSIAVEQVAVVEDAKQ